MSKLHICREHDLEYDECRVVAEKLLERLVNKFGGRVTRNGDNLSYRHATGMSAVIEPNVGHMDITVKFNMMTRSFAPQIEKQIHYELDKQLS